MKRAGLLCAGEGWLSLLCLPGQWHSVLLKHPGAVLSGAGGLGGGIGEFVPFRWQKAHTVALPEFVVRCV